MDGGCGRLSPAASSPPHFQANVARERSRAKRSVSTSPAVLGKGVIPATHRTFGCDATDPHRLSIVDPDGRGPAIGFLLVSEAKTAKNRIHIDVRVAGEPPWDVVAERERLIRERVDELVNAGATPVRELSYDGVLGHVVMFDPEGNEFCVG